MKHCKDTGELERACGQNLHFNGRSKQTDVMGFTIHLKFSYYFVCIIAKMPPILMAPFYLTTKCVPTNIPFLSLQRGEGLVAPFYRSSNSRLAHSNHRRSLDVCHAPGTDLLIHYRPYPQQFWSSERGFQPRQSKNPGA